MPVTLINANTQLTNVDQHCKVYAGPGAGKTKWLIEHINNVLYHSARLRTSRKIACITYTNVGTETIIRRLGNTADRVEVSTIHSFLYKHIIKPYVHLIAGAHELDYKKVDGHDDTVLTNFSFIDDWKSATSQQRIKPDKHDIVIEAWKDLQWQFDGTGQLVITRRHPHLYKIDGYSIKKDSYMVYKKMMWKKGWLHHDDVLFFSWQLVQQFPFLLKVLRAKFPYFFVDEFQDTNPIQVKFLQAIGAEETVVAIIGDRAQSIYSFLGADPTQFDRFGLPSMAEYRIDNNHRSTESIVNLLNKVRQDITQVSERRVPGSTIKLLVGDKSKAIQKAKEIIHNEPLYCLCRDNITTNLIRKIIDGNAAKKDLLKELHKADGTGKERKLPVISCIKAIEYARQGYFKDAIKELKYFPTTQDDSDLSRKKKCLAVLKKLLDDARQFENGSLLDLFDYLNREHTRLQGFRAGTAKSFYSATSYQHISVAVKNLDESGLFRTIHKAKGDEFDNVIVIMDTDAQAGFNESIELGFLLNPNLDGDEEQRIKYVGISRAREHLFIAVPSLSPANKTILEGKGLEVIDIPVPTASTTNN